MEREFGDSRLESKRRRGPITPLWRLHASLAVPLVVLLASFLIKPTNVPLIITCIALWMLTWWRDKYIWRLTASVRHFDTSLGSGLVLFCSPGAFSRSDVLVLRQRFEDELQVLCRQFGIAYRKRLAVYLFESPNTVKNIFGEEYAGGGTALFAVNAVIVSAEGDSIETFRHELIHILCFQWSGSAPPLLSEGIATWVGGKGTIWGRPVDLLASGCARSCISDAESIETSLFP